MIDRHILIAWVASSVCRFGSESARTPANSPKIMTGMNWAAATTPSHSGSWVSCEDEPGLGDLLHPGPDQRDRLAGEEQPVVAVAEGAACRARSEVMPRPRRSTAASSYSRWPPRDAETTAPSEARDHADPERDVERRDERRHVEAVGADLRAREDREQDGRIHRARRRARSTARC